MGVLNKLFGRFLLKSDPSTTTQTTAVIQATDTNSGIAIVPNGTGAFTLDVPDGTATGGAARGNYAVDLQMSRTNASQIAKSSFSAILGGANNQIAVSTDSTNSVIVGGTSNKINRQDCFIGGGNNNNCSNSGGNGEFATISGGRGNTTSHKYATISGGQSNTASTNTHATVVGGYLNNSTGQYSVSGGYSNIASGTGAVALGYDNTASGGGAVALGWDNTASGARSVAVGNTNTATGVGSTAFGNTSTASGESSFAAGRSTASALYSMAIGEDCVASQRGSVALGYRSKAYAFPSVAIGDRAESTGTSSFSFGVRSNGYLFAQCSYGAGSFASVGDAQGSFLVRSVQDTLTTGATTTVASNLIPNGNNRVWNVTIKYTAVVTSITGTATGVSVGDCKNEVLTVGFKKIGGTSSVVGSLNTLSTNEDSSMSTASLSVTAGTSQEMKLDFTAPTFTGGGSVTIRVVAKVELTEVAY